MCALDCVRFSIKLVCSDELALSLLQKLVTVARVGSVGQALLRSLSRSICQLDSSRSQRSK